MTVGPEIFGQNEGFTVNKNERTFEQQRSMTRLRATVKSPVSKAQRSSKW
jgi:hypothetical protein